MIKVTKILEILGANFPITFNLDIPECAKLLSSSQDEEAKCLTLELEFCDTDCIVNYSPLNLEIVDADNCEVTYALAVENVCEGLQFINSDNPISEVEKCDACDIVITAPTTGSGTYEWDFNDNLLTLDKTEGNLAYFSLNADQYLTEITTPITVTVTNENNCSIAATLNLALSIPYHVKETKGTNCLDVPKDPDTLPVTGLIKPFIFNDTYIDYDTIVVTKSNATNINYQDEGFYLTYASSEEDYVDTVEFEVLDCRGVRVKGEICVEVKACGILQVPTGNPTYIFGAELCGSPSTITFDVGSFITIESPDYTTFSLVPTGPTDIVQDNYTLTTSIGQLQFTANQEIVLDFNGNMPNGTFSVPFSINGKQGFIDFVGYPCTNLAGDFIDSEYNLCILANNSTKCFNIGEKIVGLPEGYTITIKDFPPAGLTVSINSNDELCYTANGTFIGDATFTLGILNSDGIEVDTTIINIEVKEPAAAVNTTQCDYTIDLTSYWNFTDLIPPLIYYCSDDPLTYTRSTGEVVTLNKGDNVNDSVIEVTTLGTYCFGDTTSQDSCNQETMVYFTIADSLSLPDISASVCASTDLVDFTTLPDVPEGGTWVDNNSLSSFTGTSFSPSAEGAGVYTFRYYKNNGECTSNFLLTVTVAAVPELICPKCITLCTYGEECDCDPCKVADPGVTHCEYDLYTLFELPLNSELYFKSGPYDPQFLNINGAIKNCKPGDLLPSMSAVWVATSAPVGLYTFVVKYGGACNYETELTVDLKQAVCNIDGQLTVDICTNEAVNILNLVDTDNTCLANATGGLTLISEFFTSEGSATYDLETGDFISTGSGQFVFGFTASIDGADPDCAACQVEATLVLNVRPIPGPGVPNPGAVCNDGACFVDVYPDMFTPNQSILGVFTYDGYNLASSGTPGAGGWGGTEPTPTIGAEVSPGFDFEGATPGFYFFTNTVTDQYGCTSSSQTIVQVVEALNAGTGQTVTYCTDDTDCLDLDSLLAGADPGGVWTNTSGNPDIALNSCDQGYYVAGDQADFNITNQSIGTYTFTYTLTTPPAQFPLFDGCAACAGGSADIIVIIELAVMAGDPNPLAVCE